MWNLTRRICHTGSKKPRSSPEGTSCSGENAVYCPITDRAYVAFCIRVYQATHTLSSSVIQMHPLNHLQPGKFFPLLFLQGIGDGSGELLIVRNGNVLEGVGPFLCFIDI